MRMRSGMRSVLCRELSALQPVSISARGCAGECDGCNWLGYESDCRIGRSLTRWPCAVVHESCYGEIRYSLYWGNKNTGDALPRSDFRFVARPDKTADGLPFAGDGQRETEGRALTGLTCDPDFAAMPLDNALGDGQPQPCSLGDALVVGHTVELLEDVGQVFLRDAKASIGN